jgi:hypothetical protein
MGILAHKTAENARHNRENVRSRLTAVAPPVPAHRAAVHGRPDAVVPVLPGPRLELLERGLLPGQGDRRRRDAEHGPDGFRRTRQPQRSLTPFSGNITAHAGQTVRVVIDAADTGTASLVEAGVDDVRITQQ